VSATLNEWQGRLDEACAVHDELAIITAKLDEETEARAKETAALQARLAEREQQSEREFREHCEAGQAWKVKLAASIAECGEAETKLRTVEQELRRTTVAHEAQVSELLAKTGHTESAEKWGQLRKELVHSPSNRGPLIEVPLTPTPSHCDALLTPTPTAL